MNYKIAQLALTPNEKAKIFSDIFIAQPDSIKEELGGKLFILIEIELNKNESNKIINFLIDKIYNNYYQNEKILLREKISALRVEHIFESALAKTNKEFAAFLENENINITNRSINATVGIIYNNVVYFANTGKNKAFLIYEKKEKTVKQNKIFYEKEFKIYDVTKQTGEKHSIFYKNKIFSNVVNGKIPAKGVFLISNEALPEYISQKQLIQIISTLPPNSAMEQISGILSKVNAYVSFLGIIIKNTATEKESQTLENDNLSTQESINKLNITEEKTENLLSPSGIISIKKPIEKPAAYKKNKAEATILNDKIIVKKKKMRLFSKISNFFALIIGYLVSVLQFLYNKFINFSKKLFKKKSEAVNLNSTPLIPALTEKNNEPKEKKSKFFLKNLSLKTKILLSLFVLIIIIFAINIFVIKNKKQSRLKQENYDQLINDISKKENQIDEKLIFQNVDDSIPLLDEINNLLNNLPQATEEQKAKYAELKSKKDELETKIVQQVDIKWKITRVSTPDLIYNFGSSITNSNPQNLELFPDKKQIYLGDSGLKTIDVLSLPEKIAKPIDNKNVAVNNLNLSSKLKNNIYYFNNDSVIALNTDNKSMISAPLAISGKTENVKAIGAFNKNLYLLEPEANQIYKYSQTGQIYSAPSPWLSEKIDIATASDFSIDGNIYILSENGEVQKFYQGIKQNFSLSAVNPKYKKASKLYLSPVSNYFYILDPGTNRIVIYNSKGEFLSQFIFTELNNLKDFSVDDANKTLYLLNNSSIYKYSFK